MESSGIIPEDFKVRYKIYEKKISVEIVFCRSGDQFSVSLFLAVCSGSDPAADRHFQPEVFDDRISTSGH